MSETSHSFEVYGFTIEVHAGGRRVCPPSFKRFVKNNLETCDLTIADIVKTRTIPSLKMAC